MNLPTPHINCYIKEEYLYNNDTSYKGILKCKIIGITTYIGEPITFHVMVEDKYLYSNIPINAIQSSKYELTETYGLKTISYLNAPKYEIDLFAFNQMGVEFKVFFKDINSWTTGTKYFFSVDFYTDNELVHFVELSNGQFAFVPNHKINWGNITELPGYKKQTKTFKL